MKYALRVTGVEVRHHLTGTIMASEGDVYWVVCSDEFCVSGVKSTLGKDGRLPTGVVLFESVEAASDFGRRWKGHPWWVVPKSFEVVEVEPVYVIGGWKEKRHGVQEEG